MIVLVTDQGLGFRVTDQASAVICWRLLFEDPDVKPEAFPRLSPYIA